MKTNQIKKKRQKSENWPIENTNNEEQILIETYIK